MSRLLALWLAGCGVSEAAQHEPATAKEDKRMTPNQTHTRAQDGVAASAEETRPLAVGVKVPNVTYRDADGKEVSLRARVTEAPTALVYYRGGWCPYCSLQLGKLKEVEGELKQLGFRIVGISADKPGKIRESRAKIEPGYELLSDATMEGARAFGIAFAVPLAYRTKLKGFGMDIEEASGQVHHILPVPAVFLIDTAGVIRFAYANPDYKVRLDNEALLAAAKKMKAEGGTPATQ